MKIIIQTARNHRFEVLHGKGKVFFFFFSAIDFVVEKLENDGFDDVYTEEVPDLPNWVRGNDRVEMIGIEKKKLFFHSNETNV